MTEQKKFYKEIKEKLESEDTSLVIATLNDLKETGHAYILPLIFNLLETTSSKQIRDIIIRMIADIKEQACVPVIIEELQSNRLEALLPEIIMACWQGDLDFSEHLDAFAQLFIDGDYRQALEAFTVIEETLHNCTDEVINACENILKEGVTKISDEKKPLYSEMIKVLEEHL